MPRLGCWFIGCVCGMYWLTVPLHAEEWARFRGPNGTGESESTTIPATWTDQDYQWRIKLPGVGNSSPIVWKDHIYLLSADPETATRIVLCVSASSGEIVWQKAFPSTKHHVHQFSSFASSTPAADAEHVYVAWSAPENLILMALTHAGEIVWEKQLGPWTSQHGFGTSPMLIDDLVILSNTQELKLNERATGIPPKSYLLAFDRKSGNERWRIERKTDNVTYSVPAIFTPRGGQPQLVNTSTGSGLYAIEPKTGKELWTIAAFDKRTVSSPVVLGDFIIGSTGSGNGGNYVAAVRSDGTQAEKVYRIDTQAPYVPTVVAKGQLLFLIGDSGVAACVDLPTGNVHWRERIGGTYQGSPVRAGDKIICISVDGQVVVIAAEKSFQELGRVELGEGTRSTPAIAEGRLIIRTFSQLMSVGGSDRKTISQNR